MIVWDHFKLGIFGNKAQNVLEKHHSSISSLSNIKQIFVFIISLLVEADINVPSHVSFANDGNFHCC